MRFTPQISRCQRNTQLKIEHVKLIYLQRDTQSSDALFSRTAIPCPLLPSSGVPPSPPTSRRRRRTSLSYSAMRGVAKNSSHPRISLPLMILQVQYLSVVMPGLLVPLEMSSLGTHLLHERSTIKRGGGIVGRTRNSTVVRGDAQGFRVGCPDPVPKSTN